MLVLGLSLSACESRLALVSAVSTSLTLIHDTKTNIRRKEACTSNLAADTDVGGFCPFLSPRRADSCRTADQWHARRHEGRPAGGAHGKERQLRGTLRVANRLRSSRELLPVRLRWPDPVNAWSDPATGLTRLDSEADEPGKARLTDGQQQLETRGRQTAWPVGRRTTSTQTFFFG